MERIVANGAHTSPWVTKRSQSVRFSKSSRQGANGDQSASSRDHPIQLSDKRSPKRIGIIVFNRMTAADLTGPAEVFYRHRIEADREDERRSYDVVTIGVSGESCETESGIVVKPQVDMQHAPLLDTIIVPGGSGIHDPKLNNVIAKWLNCRAPGTRRIAALGTGIYALAATGLLDRSE